MYLPTPTTIPGARRKEIGFRNILEIEIHFNYLAAHEAAIWNESHNEYSPFN
jgi:hypothetical protein